MEPDIDEVQKLGESHVTIVTEGKIIRLGSTWEPGDRERSWSLGFSRSHQIVKGFYDRERQATEADNDAARKCNKNREAAIQGDALTLLGMGTRPVEKHRSFPSLDQSSSIGGPIQRLCEPVRAGTL